MSREGRIHADKRQRLRRRDVLAAVAVAAGAATWPRLAWGGPRRLLTIGYLSEGGIPAPGRRLDAFRAGLADTGYVEGRNVAIAFRAAKNDRTRLPELARELVRLPVDVIVAPGSLDAIQAARAASKTIPIVFSNAGDWTKSPLIASLHRPGGNVTGVSDFGNTLSAKRVELLKLLVPTASAVAVLVSGSNVQSANAIGDAREGVRSLGVELSVHWANTAEEIDAAFTAFEQTRLGGLCVAPSVLFYNRAAQIIGLAARHRLPAIYPDPQFAEAGGLMSYGTDLKERQRQTGIYVGMLLNGAKPADLPVRRLAHFELAINVKTAKALGLPVPATFLAFADKVIE